LHIRVHPSKLLRLGIPADAVENYLVILGVRCRGTLGIRGRDPKISDQQHPEQFLEDVTMTLGSKKGFNLMVMENISK
jgi:hypothetical protein